MRDTDLSTHLQVNSADGIDFIRVKVEGLGPTVGSVFIFADSMTAGDYDVFVHSGEVESVDDLVGSLNYNVAGSAGGIVSLASPRAATYVTIKCVNCAPAMKIHMLRIYTDQVVGLGIVPSIFSYADFAIL